MAFANPMEKQSAGAKAIPWRSFLLDQTAGRCPMDSAATGGKVRILSKVQLKTMTSHHRLGSVQLCLQISDWVWEIRCGQGWSAHHSAGSTDVRLRGVPPRIIMGAKA